MLSCNFIKQFYLDEIAFGSPLDFTTNMKKARWKNIPSKIWLTQESYLALTKIFFFFFGCKKKTVVERAKIVCEKFCIQKKDLFVYLDGIYFKGNIPNFTHSPVTHNMTSKQSLLDSLCEQKETNRLDFCCATAFRYNNPGRALAPPYTQKIHTI